MSIHSQFLSGTHAPATPATPAAATTYTSGSDPAALEAAIANAARLETRRRHERVAGRFATYAVTLGTAGAAYYGFEHVFANQQDPQLCALVLGAATAAVPLLAGSELKRPLRRRVRAAARQHKNLKGLRDSPSSHAGMAYPEAGLKAARKYEQVLSEEPTPIKVDDASLPIVRRAFNLVTARRVAAAARNLAVIGAPVMPVVARLAENNSGIGHLWLLGCATVAALGQAAILPLNRQLRKAAFAYKRVMGADATLSHKGITDIYWAEARDPVIRGAKLIGDGMNKLFRTEIKPFRFDRELLKQGVMARPRRPQAKTAQNAAAPTAA